MRLLALLAVSLLSCGPNYRALPAGARCITECGLIMLERGSDGTPAPAEWTCEHMQTFEDHWFSTLELVTDIRFTEACRQVDGTQFVPHEGPLEPGDYIGLTQCPDGPVTVNIHSGHYTTDVDTWISWPIWSHELAHVVQRCTPEHLDEIPPYGGLPDGGVDRQHWFWDRDGIYKQQAELGATAIVYYEQFSHH